MPSAKQIAANRANSQKSTGPRTDAGRARASLNALKHGCTAQTMIFPGEDGAHFHAFHQSFIQDFAPVGALEHAMVQDLAQTQWAMNRTRAHEASLFALAHERLADSIDAQGDQAIQSALAGGLAFNDEAITLKNIGLYLQRHSRMFLNTLKVLREIQAARQASAQAKLEQAVHFAHMNRQLIKPHTLAELGFDYAPELLAAPLRRLALLQAVKPPRKSPHIHVTNAA